VLLCFGEGGQLEALQWARVLTRLVLRLLDVAKRLRLAGWVGAKRFLVGVLGGGGGSYEVLFDEGTLLMEVMGAGR